MAVNRYFNHITNTAEQEFFEDFVVETIQIAGLDVKYLPRTHNIDDILKEELQSQFTSAWTIEAYFHDIQGFGGENDLMTKFGFQQADTVNLSIAKKSWRRLNVTNRTERPQEGDIIYIPFSKSFFEITFVEHEDPFWQLGRYNVFKLSCQMYTRGYNEKFSTVDSAINTGANADNVAEINSAINEAIQTKSTILLDFTEKNPFGGM